MYRLYPYFQFLHRMGCKLIVVVGIKHIDSRMIGDASLIFRIESANAPYVRPYLIPEPLQIGFGGRFFVAAACPVSLKRPPEKSLEQLHALAGRILMSVLPLAHDATVDADLIAKRGLREISL